MITYLLAQIDLFYTPQNTPFNQIVPIFSDGRQEFAAFLDSYPVSAYKEWGLVGFSSIAEDWYENDHSSDKR
jgi:hypothetical protein